MNEIKRKNDLLAKLANKSLDMDYFLLECARWTAETISAYQWKPLPEKSRQVLVYENFPAKNSLDGAYFQDNPEVLAYYRTYNTIKCENDALRDWLNQCYKLFIKFNDFANAELVNDKLKEEHHADIQVGDTDLRTGGQEEAGQYSPGQRDTTGYQRYSETLRD